MLYKLKSTTNLTGYQGLISSGSYTYNVLGDRYVHMHTDFLGNSNFRKLGIHQPGLKIFM